MLSPTKLLLIVLLVLIVFGAGKLPKVMGDLGKGLKNFKEGLHDAEEAKDVSPKPQPQALENKPEVPPAQASATVEADSSKKS